MAYLISHVTWRQDTMSNKLADGVIWIGTIDPAAKGTIAIEHGKVMLECYIDPQHLFAIASSNGRSPVDIFSEEILPDAPHLISGDFGEILCRSALQEWRDCPVFELLRWRNRSTKNDTVRGVDLLGCVVTGSTPHEDDLLVLCEVKTRSLTTSSTIAREAFDGVRNDFISRLANSLYFHQIHLRREGKSVEADRYARFANPYGVAYKTRLSACVVHEKTTWDDMFLGQLPDRHGLLTQFEVVVLCVDDLAGWIKEVRRSAVSSAQP